MKNIFLLLVFFTCCNWAQGQLQATLNVDSNPTPELSEWTNRNNLAILTVTNPVAGVLIDYRIKVSLLLDGDVKLMTDDSVPFMTADFGTETFLADELIPYNAVQFIDPSFRDQIARTGMLPPGAYSFCVELIGVDGSSLTQPEQICRPMIITDYQMPELLSPVDGKVIDPLLINSLMFQWTPLVPVPDAMTGISYLIAVSEVQPGQTPSQAFSVNYPIIEEEITIGTQYVWPLDLPAPDEDQQYVWGIKPMTNEGNTYRAQNNGFVDIGVFMINGNNKSDDSVDEVKSSIVKEESTKEKVKSSFVKDKSSKEKVKSSIVKNKSSEVEEETPIVEEESPLQVSLNVDSNPTPEISEWVNRNNLAILTVTNTDSDWSPQYRIKVEMYKNGDLMLETNDNVVEQTLGLGTVTFLADEIIPYNAIDFRNNSFQQTITQTGMLPAGQYSFCLSLLHVDTGLPLASNPLTPICKPMTITQYQLPELISPINDFEVNSQLLSNLVFNWTPITPAPPQDLGVKYTIAISEVNAGQSSASQAFNINTPIILQENLAFNQFTWPDDISAPTEETQYVWSVKAVSTSNENPFVQGNNGFVQTQTFKISPTAAVPVELEDCECDTYNLTPPVIAIIQQNPSTLPRELSLTNVNELKEYFINCNSEYNVNPANYTIETTIKWGENTDAVVVSGSDFKNLYTNASDIPSEICVNYTLKFALSNDDICVKQFCIPVPEDLVNLEEIAAVEVGDIIYAGENHEFEVVVSEITTDAATNKLTGKGTVDVGWLGARVAVSFSEITIDNDKNLLTGKILGDIYEAPAPVYPTAWGEEILGNNGGNAPAALVENWTNSAVSDIVDWTNDTAGDAVDWVNNTAGTSIGAPQIDPAAVPQVNAQTTPVKLPLGVNYANGDQFAITEMVFRPNLSEFNLVAAKNTPPSWQGPGEDPQLIGFIAKSVRFHPSRVETPPARLELLENVTVGNMNNKITFEFISPASNSDGGCYIEWDENGFSQFVIELESTFSREWLLPVPDDGSSRSTATFMATVTNWDDLVLEGSLEESELVASQGMIVEVGTISLDLSDTLNSVALQSPSGFPSNYEGTETSALFRGFHMDQASVRMPDSWQTHADGAPELSINDMIINDTGVTLIAEASNVAAFRGATIADLIASVDTLKIDLRSSSLHEGYVKGRIALPLTKEDSIRNPLQYKALFTAATASEGSSFQLVVEPTGPINASLLKGEMELSPTSNIVAAVSKNPAYNENDTSSKKFKKTFQSTLNGNFVWDNVKLGPVNNVNMNLGFQGIEMNYNNLQPTNRFNFNPGTWAFASPQKFLANFPVTISNIDFETKPITGNQLVHGDLTFDVIFNLSDNIGGQTKMALEMAIEDNPGGSGTGKFKPKYINTGIDAISIYANLPAVSIQGSLEFRTDDLVYGNGFKGELEAAFKTPNIGITAIAEFGNTNHLNNGETYRYWRVEAAAKFSPGLPFLPGLSFNGFGGGAYNNMESSLLIPSSGNGPNDKPAHYTFLPKKGNLGFKVEATIATAGSTDSFNADVGLNGQFSRSDGLINIGFTGDFYIGGPLTPQIEREKAQVKGSVVADYNFPDKHFTMNVDATVNTADIKTIPGNPANLNIDIDGRNNLWHFKFGEPSNPNTVKVFGLSLYEYLTFGNNIEGPTGFTQTFQDGWAQAFNDTNAEPSIAVTSGVNDDSELGKGFAFGVGFKFNHDIEADLINGWKANVDITAGAELNLSMMQQTGINCRDSSKEFGLNGWRATGSVGFYGSLNLYASKPGKDNKEFLFIGAGGTLEGKFPGPTYVKGRVRILAQLGRITKRVHNIQGDCDICRAEGVHQRTLHLSQHFKIGGRQALTCNEWETFYLINKDFDKSFEWGDDCYPTSSSSSSTQSFDQQDAAGDQAERLITYIHPDPSTIIYNYPVTKPISLKFGLIPDNVFDVGEQQSTGAVATRVFKLEREVKMYVDEQDNGVFVEVPEAARVNNPPTTNSSGFQVNNPGYTTVKGLMMHENNLGEELYVLEQEEPFDGNVSVQVVQNAAFSSVYGGNNTTTMASYIGNMSMATTTNSGMNTGAFNNNSLLSSQSGAPALMYPAPPSGSGPAVTPTPSSGGSGPANYGTLPQAEEPIVNDLEVNKTYKIVVVARLKEYVNNTNWINALDSDNNPVSETKEKRFRTGPLPVLDVSGAMSTGLNTVAPASSGTNVNGSYSNNRPTMFSRPSTTGLNRSILANNRAILGVN